MSAREAVIAIGANLGDRAESIARAIDELALLPGTRVRAVATPIETIAVTLTGPDPDAPPYLNTVALLDTTLEARELLEHLQAVEQRHGRVRTGARWTDRTLDLDLITLGEVVMDDPDLILPHPRAAERAFVLAPWASIDSQAVLPGYGSVPDLLAGLGESQ